MVPNSTGIRVIKLSIHHEDRTTQHRPLRLKPARPQASWIAIYWLSFSSFSLYSFLFHFFFHFVYLSPYCSSSFIIVVFVIRAYKQIFGLFIYSALPISRGHFSPNNSRRTPIARSLGRDMDDILEFEVFPKFLIRNWCVGWTIVLYCTAIYRVYSIK